MNDEIYMNKALEEAKKAYDQEEIPVGAVIVKDGEIIAKAHNTRNKSNRVIDHAEILAICEANKKMKNWRLEDCDIYITLEPCPMCASAIEQARIRKVITGAVNNNENTKRVVEEILKKKEWKKEINKEECTYIMDLFFKDKR